MTITREGRCGDGVQRRQAALYPIRGINVDAEIGEHVYTRTGTRWRTVRWGDTKDRREHANFTSLH